MSTPNPQAIEAFIQIAGRLIAIMEQELGSLRKMEIAEIAGLQEEKNTLVAAYEDGIRQFDADPDTLNALQPALKAELTDLAARFDDVVMENSRALEAVRDSHERLLRTIVDAVSENRARHSGYSDTGGKPQPAGGIRAARLSLTLDRQL